MDNYNSHFHEVKLHCFKNYASEFKLEANNEMNLMNWINTLHVLDNGKLILAAGLAGNVLECRSLNLVLK